MSHELFRDVVSPQIRVRSRSRYTVSLSILVHALIVAGVIVIPLLASNALPAVPDSDMSYVIPIQPPAPPAAPAPPLTARTTPPVNPDAAPIDPPDGIHDELPRQPPVGETVIGGLPSLGPSGNGLGTPINLGTAVALPDPPAPPAPTKPVRPGGLIREPVKVRHVPPVYPQIAIAARVSGTVVIDAVIGTDGTVREARVLSGTPLLNQAALDAVRQWRYTPTTLNNVPVPVIMTVTVKFQLQ